MHESASAQPGPGSVTMPLEQNSEWREGWRTLFAASLGTGVGLPLFLLTAGLFIIPMQEEFKWSRSAVTIGPVVMFVGAILQPLVGGLIDRFGSRLIALLGLSMLALIYPLLALTPPNPWIFYSIVACLALAGPACNGVALLKGVATWFTKNSGLAIGLTLTGPSITSAIALPVIATIIETYGWRAGFLALFALVAVFGLPVVWLMFRERPQQPAQTRASGTANSEQRASQPASYAGASLKEAVCDKRYWILVTAITAAAIPMGGFLSQLQPFLASNGFTASAAATVGTSYALAIGIGRIVAGKCLDEINPSIVAAVCLSLPAVGAFMLVLGASVGTPWLLAAIAVFLVGLGQGAEIDFIAYFTLRLFGLRSFSLIFGTMAMVVSGSMAVGGMVLARVYDAFGSYHGALILSVFLYLLAAGGVLLIKVPPQQSE
jgi:sugar phosphate permease